MVAKANTYIEGLEEEKREQGEALIIKERELRALEREVYYAITDIPAGQVISGDMVKMERILTEFDEGFFMNTSQLGAVAASIPIKTGTPVMAALTGQVFPVPSDETAEGRDGMKDEFADLEDIGVEGSEGESGA